MLGGTTVAVVETAPQDAMQLARAAAAAVAVAAAVVEVGHIFGSE